jgi:hypothetical protein
MNGRGDNTTGKELERKNRARRSGKGNGRFGSRTAPTTMSRRGSYASDNGHEDLRSVRPLRATNKLLHQSTLRWQMI